MTHFTIAGEPMLLFAVQHRFMVGDDLYIMGRAPNRAFYTVANAHDVVWVTQ